MPDRRFVLATLAALALAAPALEAAVIPRAADDLAITLASGKQVTLSQYKGKVVAVIFILTTCAHCQAAIQCLIQDQSEFGPRGFQAIASAIEEEAQTSVPDFIRRFKPPFPVGYSGLKPSMDFLQHPPKLTPHMPLIAFIDRHGMVQAQYEGMDPFFVEERMAGNLHDKIAALMGQRTPATEGKGCPGPAQEIEPTDRDAAGRNRSGAVWARSPRADRGARSSPPRSRRRAGRHIPGSAPQNRPRWPAGRCGSRTTTRSPGWMPVSRNMAASISGGLNLPLSSSKVL